MRIVLLSFVAAWSLAVCAGELPAENRYRRPARRTPLPRPQQIVDVRQPQSMSSGGGLMFDPGSGSLQITAVGRDRFTGRLQYYSQYVNPWTGARYATASQFNPFTGRYQTVHRFVPPPSVERAADAAESPRVEEFDLPKRGIRVIETKNATDETPVEEMPDEVAPPREATESTSPTRSATEKAEKPAVSIEIRTP